MSLVAEERQRWLRHLAAERESRLAETYEVAMTAYEDKAPRGAVYNFPALKAAVNAALACYPERTDVPV